MEKWKIAVIIGLIAMMGSYQVYQSRPQAPAAQGATNSATGPDAVSTPMPPQPTFLGKSIPGWTIPQPGYWMNTPKPLVLSDLKGSPTVIEFFRIECSHCQNAAPLIAAIYRKYKARGLKVVSIQAPGTSPEENNWKTVQQTVRSWGWTHPVAFDAEAKNFRNLYKGQSYPSIYVLNKKGIVIHQHTGEDEMKTKALIAAVEKAVR